MTRILAMVALLLMAGCAASTVPAVPATHPASTSAQSALGLVEVSSLPPAPQPTLPAPLRPDGHPPAGSALGLDPAASQMDHGQMDHGSTAEMAATAETSGSQPAPPPEGLPAALDAYLAIQAALAGDSVEGVAEQARALDAAIAAMTETPPIADPHFWHMRAAETTALRGHAQSLAGAQDVGAARMAFGTLSVPMITLVQAVGVPAGYDLALMSCGMAPGVPEGGVWMQRPGATANPFFGSAMPTCGTATGTVSDAGGHAGH